MKRNYILSNVSNVSITLFNDEDDCEEVLRRRAGGTKKTETRLHDDVAQARLDSQITDGKCRLIPV